MNKEILGTLNELTKKPITDLALSYMEVVADNLEKDKEIERLNNIITELENDLEKLVEESISRRKESKNATEHSINSAYIYAYMESLDKLKELKEGKDV